MTYLFVLEGRRGRKLQSFRRPLSIDIRADSTQMVVEVRDDAEVFGILERLDRLGIRIVRFAQVT